MIGYHCVGGPLDGQLRALPAGVDKFEVIQGPPLDWEALDAWGIRPDQVKLHRYQLRTLAGGGKVWEYVS